MFADDVKLFRKILCFSDARELQNDLNELHHWCRMNKLSLNTNKCYVMTTTRKLLPNQHLFNYNISGTPLLRVNTFKDLGITFDSKHTFESHVNVIVIKAFRTLGFISRSLNKFRNMETFILLYNTYVRSALEYGSVIWSPQYVIYVERIEKVQRSFTRRLFRKFHYIYESYENRLIRLGLLSLYDRRIASDEIVFYKLCNNILSSNISNNIVRRNSYVNLRRRTQFYPPFASTNIEHHSAYNRMQRKHDELFGNIDLNTQPTNAFKRYVIHELRSVQTLSPY